MSNALTKIDKLLKLSENNPSQAEADAALKKAAQLMRAYIDDPNETHAAQRSLKQELAEKEARLEKICTGCAAEKPDHKEGCPYHALQRKMSVGLVTGCFSCAGISIVGFILSIWALLEKVFG